MEVTDILKTNHTNLTGITRAISSNNDKFRRLLAGNIEHESMNSTPIAGKKEKQIDKKLMDVCIEMESIFVSKMLKEMRNTLPKEKLIDGGFAEKVFEDMLYDEYSLNLSKTSNLGIARMLYNELSSK